MGVPRGGRDGVSRQGVIVKRIGQAVVVTVGLASGAISFIQAGMNPTTVTIITLAILLTLSVAANVVALLDTRKVRKRSKQIAFLTPSSGDQPFYTAVLGNLVRCASLAFGQDYLVVPSVPTQSFEAMSIWSLFARLEDRHVEVDGIIFIPDHPDDHFDELVGFHEKRGDVPLVLADVYFDLDSCDARTRARLPSFVGGDEKAGGVLAAEIIIGALEVPEERSPVVLVINGGTAPWEQQRAVACRQRLITAWAQVRFIESPAINYDRSAAFDFVTGEMRRVADLDRLVCVDAIFACNDDMAIGARGAINHLMREGYRFPQPPQIVGYDGISEMREYLRGGDAHLAGTVDVRIEEQARRAMLLMHKLIRSGQRGSEVDLVAPRSILRS